MAKPSGLPDMDVSKAGFGGDGSGNTDDPRFDPRFDDDGVHEIHQMIRKVLDEHPDTMAVGEIWVNDEERLARYLRPDELHLAFNFRLVLTHFDADAMRTSIERSLAVPRAAGAPATWTLSNHDVWRTASRYGGGPAGVRRARAMALVELALPGAVYLYNGEELGLENVDLPPEAMQDPRARTQGPEFSRDAARVPMPWEGDLPPFGFSRNPRTWLPMPASWASLTVERQLEDGGSTLTLYRRAVELRKHHPAFRVGDELEWYGAPAGCFAFRRGKGGLICALNTSASSIALPPGELLLSSSPLVDGRLPPDATAWLV
jgi:alpha-glucosidase